MADMSCVNHKFKINFMKNYYPPVSEINNLSDADPSNLHIKSVLDYLHNPPSDSKGRSSMMKQSKSTQIKRRKISLTQANIELITDCVNMFVDWLSEQKLKKIDKTLFSFEFFQIEETMVVGKKKDLHFNLEYLKKCSVDYFITIVLHEAYHYFINNIPNKSDAKRVKDFYYHQMMNHIDIEADFYVAKFFKEKLGFSLDDYLTLG